MNAVIRSKHNPDPSASASIGASKPGRDVQDELVKIRKELLELLRILNAL